METNYQNEIEKLQENLKGLRKMQSLMRQANVVCRKKKLTDDDKVKELVSLGLSESTSKKILEPDYCGRIGFPSYELTSINEKIKRAEKRINELSKKDSSEDYERRIEDKGLTIEVSYTENRIRLLYDDKPSADTIAELKRYGFKWSPSNSAWQRMITNDSFWAVEHVTGIDLRKKETA